MMALGSDFGSWDVGFVSRWTDLRRSYGNRYAQIREEIYQLVAAALRRVARYHANLLVPDKVRRQLFPDR